WCLPDDVAGLRTFALTMVEAVGGRVAAIKPQSAFFERHGSAGVAVLEETVAAATASGSVVILDAKRGDIGSTMAGYADAYLRDGGPLAADALTVSPYLGPDSLGPTLATAVAGGRGLFVLCLTSNPEGAALQHAGGPATAPAVQVAQWAREQNAVARAAGDAFGPVGLVVGATVGDAARDLGLDLDVGGVLLAPGLGAQGAGREELRRVFGDARGAVLAAASRAVSAAGPDVTALRAAASATTLEATAALR
ncbi:MAG TPA: orotidine-5'-phosphate decarboxylase, partial [Actinotalea sp.]|nr:orotidine-5'-phosphate decarboxylase [Actinotalea sp.]